MMVVTKASIDPCILCNVLAPIFICGFFGNIICIIVFLRRRFRTRSISVYFVALFFNDCLLLFISHIAKMLMFNASQSCWFNIFLSKLIEIIHYEDLINHGSLAVITYNTTYTQISMLIFMFMSIQRVRTFSSISYRESRLCAFVLILIAFIYGITVSYMQLYDGFCIRELKLNQSQTLQINLLINDTKYEIHEKCHSSSFLNQSVSHWPEFSLNHSITNEVLINNTINPVCGQGHDWERIRHRTVAYVHLQSHMLINWFDEFANRSECDFEELMPKLLLEKLDYITRPFLKYPPGKDYFLEHQYCSQLNHFIGSYANCSLPMSAKRFKKFYQFLYDRRLSLKNRFTIGFVIGTFIPSAICIISSLICLYYISNQPLIRKHSHSRAELRSFSLILVEILLCLMSALQSYIINFFTCHRVLFRMKSDNCYGSSSDENILPIFLGSIVELFTSTSNIIILMICGSQFRNELIEIFGFRRLFPKRQKLTRDDECNVNRRQSNVTLPLQITVKSKTSNIDVRKKSTMNQSHDPKMNSLLKIASPNDDISLTDTEQHSEQASQCLIKLTTV